MNFRHLYLWTNLIVIGIGSVLFGYWYFIDGTYIGQPVKILSDTSNYKTDKEIYHRGETVFVDISFCKLRQIPANTQWRFVDGIVLPLSTGITFSTPVGCYGIDKRYLLPIVTIPESDALIGTDWRLSGTLVYHVNPLKDITIEVVTQKFTIE